MTFNVNDAYEFKLPADQEATLAELVNTRAAPELAFRVGFMAALASVANQTRIAFESPEAVAGMTGAWFQAPEPEPEPPAPEPPTLTVEVPEVPEEAPVVEAQEEIPVPSGLQPPATIKVKGP